MDENFASAILIGYQKLSDSVPILTRQVEEAPVHSPANAASE